MAELPKVTENDFTERTGIIAVQIAVNTARCVWRELEHRDIGIDGHIEYITPEGLAPGRLVGVQVKSGASRFTDATQTEVPFKPPEKHARYWSEYPMPVILVLHNPETAETIWCDARHQLRTSGAVSVPRTNTLEGHGILRCLESGGPLPTGAFDAQRTAAAMVAAYPQELCFLFLFAQGLTDIANSLYFGMDVLSEVLDSMSAAWDLPGYSLGADEFKFVDDYVGFLVSHDLARVDYAFWKQWIEEYNMVGTFIAPLTEKGRAVRNYIATVDQDVPTDESRYAVAIRERLVQMVYNPSGYDEFADRQRRLERIRSEIVERLGL